MEGVLVSAKKDGSTITTTVVSDEQGRIAFLPRNYIRVIIRFEFGPSATTSMGQAAVAIAAVDRTRLPTSSSQDARSCIAAFEHGMAVEAFPAPSRRRPRYAHARTATRWSVWRARTTTLRN